MSGRGVEHPNAGEERVRLMRLVAAAVCVALIPLDTYWKDILENQGDAQHEGQ